MANFLAAMRPLRLGRGGSSSLRLFGPRCLGDFDGSGRRMCRRQSLGSQAGSFDFWLPHLALQASGLVQECLSLMIAMLGGGCVGGLVVLVVGMVFVWYGGGQSMVFCSRYNRYTEEDTGLASSRLLYQQRTCSLGSRVTPWDPLQHVRRAYCDQEKAKALKTL